MRFFQHLESLPSFKNSVLTIGSFDGVHRGHRKILERVTQLAAQCHGESIVITFDPHPRTVLRPHDQDFKLITTTAEKIALLEKAGIDNVVAVPFSKEFAQLSAEAYVEEFLIKRFQPRFIVIGYDHRFGNNREGDIAFLKQYEASAGFEVIEIPAQEIDEIAVSSSKVRKDLDAARISHANLLLGHPFLFSGKVIEGNKIGRTIGFPTANLLVEDPYKLILPDGIYAARAYHSAQTHDAMLYIGDRPSIEGAGQRVIEVNLIDFEGDLYGQNLTVEVIDHIRGDKKLDSLEALQQQIATDKLEIQKRLADNAIQDKSLGSPQTSSVAPVATAVAIVILNYNTRKHLEAYLPTVIRHSQGARIIVADNGSPDDSIAFLRQRFPEVEIIDLKHNYGFAQGYNEALKQVDADYYVILNSDVEVTAGWIEPIVEAMQQNPTIAIAQPKILAWRVKSRFEYAGAAGGWMDTLGYPFCRGRIFQHVEEDNGQYDAPQACFWAAGAAFFIRAKLYHAFGGFDGDYFAHNEEIDLCWRLKRAGYGVWCFPQSTVYHLGGGTLEYESPRKVFLNFRNSLFTLIKNERASTLLWLIPARFLLDGAAGAMFAMKGQWKSIQSIVKAHFSFYGQLGQMLQKRKAVAAIIEKERIGQEMDKSGIFSGSIVWCHYISRIKEFSKVITSAK